MFRCVECESGVQPDAMAQFGVPADFVDLSSGRDPFKLMDLLQLVGPPGARSPCLACDTSGTG